MIEKIINGIKYCLNEETQTAEVIRRKGFEYEGNIIIPETTVFNDVIYRVTSIGEHAFDCCQSLTDITFQGTIAQWNEIELSNGWNHELPATVVHCKDGDIAI